MADFCEKKFSIPTSQGERMTMAARNFLGYCFLAETGLKASETILVVHRNGVSEMFSFERREPNDPVWKKELEKLRAEVRLLTAENELLKRKAGL